MIRCVPPLTVFATRAAAAVMRTTLVLCALLSAASGLTLRPCGRPTSRRALLAGSLCAAVLPAFAEEVFELPAAAPSRMYQNGLVVPELASEPAAAPAAAATTLAEPDEITRAARSRTESLEPILDPSPEPRHRLAAHLAAHPPFRRYTALVQKIKECMSGACEVDKVEFTSSNGDAGFAIVRGRRLPIRGIPPENPNSEQPC